MHPIEMIFYRAFWSVAIVSQINTAGVKSSKRKAKKKIYNILLASLEADKEWLVVRKEFIH